MNDSKRPSRPWRVLVGALLAVLAVVAIGVAAYDAGVAHGLAQQVSVTAGPGAYPYPYYWHRPWGFGIFFPLLFALLFLRLVFWGALGHRRFYGRGYCGGGRYDVPPAFEEWHRRAHERGPQDPAPTSV